MQTVTPTRRAGKARLFVRLNGEPYRLTQIRRNHWALTRPDGAATYHVQRLPGADWSCTCPDHLRRTVVCKHVGALMACGLLPKIRPRKVVADV